MLRADEIERLSLLRAGELEVHEVKALRQELAARADLRQALERLDALDDLTAALPPARSAAPDPAAAKAVFQRARELRRNRTLWSAAAAAVLVCGLGWAFVSRVWPALQIPSGPGWARVDAGELLLAPGARVRPTAHARAFKLTAGTVLAVGQGLRFATPGGEVLLFGIAVLTREPEQALAHATKALLDYPGRQEMGTKLGALLANAVVRKRLLPGLALLLLEGTATVTTAEGAEELQAGPAPIAAVSERAPFAKAPPQPKQQDDAAGPICLGASADAERLNALLDSRARELRRCFEAAAGDTPKAVTGLLIVELSVGPDGTLRDGTISPDYSVQSPLVGSCLLSELSRLRFPAPAAGASTWRCLPFRAHHADSAGALHLEVLLPGQLDALNLLESGIAKVKAGDTVGATDYFKACLAITAKKEFVLRCTKNLGIVYAKRKSNAAAVSTFNTYLSLCGTGCQDRDAVAAQVVRLGGALPPANVIDRVAEVDRGSDAMGPKGPPQQMLILGLPKPHLVLHTKKAVAAEGAALAVRYGVGSSQPVTEAVLQVREAGSSASPRTLPLVLVEGRIFEAVIPPEQAHGALEYSAHVKAGDASSDSPWFQVRFVR